MLSAIGARVIDRELPIGMADDAFATDGTLLDDDLSLTLAGILAELQAETRPLVTRSLNGQAVYLRLNFTAPPGMHRAGPLSSYPKFEAPKRPGPLGAV